MQYKVVLIILKVDWGILEFERNDLCLKRQYELLIYVFLDDGEVAEYGGLRTPRD